MSDRPREEPGVTPRSRWRPLLGFAIGLLLLGAAIRAVAAQDLAPVWTAARDAPMLLAAGVLLLPLVDWLLMSATFQALMRPYGRVGPGEMAALIGASWLLNYLPLKPGVFGRIAYHRSVNGIPVTDSLRAIAGNVGAGFAAFACGVALAVGAHRMPAGASSDTSFAGGAAAVMLASVAVAVAARRLGPGWHARAAAFGLRFVDLLAWALRYWLVFRLVGAPISMPAAMSVAVVAQAAALVPFLGNGLGLTEWAVGLTAAALPAGWAAGGGPEQHVGLLAALVSRAAEMAMAIPVGAGSTWWLSHRWGSGFRGFRARPAVEPQTPGSESQ